MGKGGKWASLNACILRAFRAGPSLPRLGLRLRRGGGGDGPGSGAYNLTGSTYAPEGEVLTANDSANGDWQYEYGPLNHPKEFPREILPFDAACSPSCSSPSIELQYAFDRFGNQEFPQGIPPKDGRQQNVLAGAAPSPQLAFNANNQIVGASYDASGDMTSDGNGNLYSYDAEGRVVCAYPGGGSCQSPTASYVYNALGQRVEKLVGGTAKYYLYNLAGHAVATLGPSGNWLRGAVYAAGRPLATYDNGTTYFGYGDWLGMLRVQATVTGGPFESRTSLPYGDELSCAGPDGPMDANAASPLHFTGQHHDDETGLDHFPARYYTSSWGLFTTPDDGSAQSVADGQSWDPYGYARDNPATLTDPSGRDVLVCVTTGRADASQQTCTVMSDEQYHQLYEAQNGKQEINMPGGTFPNGNITCGGKVCGSAQYFEPGMQDQSLNLFAISGLGDLAIGGLRAGAAAAEDIVGAVARFAEDAPAAASGAAEAGAPRWSPTPPRSPPRPAPPSAIRASPSPTGPPPSVP